nr:hypothetical protein [Tanacetum cinerariifolium]
MDPFVTHREENYQVVLDIIKNTPCYNAFLISTDLPKIYMQQFYVTIKKIDNPQSKIKRCEIMPYARFTKAIIYHFMTKHKSISSWQRSPYRTVDDDEVLDRLKFINKGDIYQVYGKPIPDTWITNEIKKSEAYKIYFKYSIGLIPTKKGRGKGPQGTKSKRKSVVHDESEESEGEPENRLTGRKKTTPRAVVIQEPLSIPAKKTQESSGKLKDLDVGAGTSPEEYLLAYKDEKPEDIPWQSTNDDESKNDKEEDDARIDIEKTDYKRTDTDDEDMVMGKAEKTVEQKADEEHEANKEQKGDEHAKDEQVVVPVSTT